MVELEFYHWIEQVPVTGVIAFPQSRVKKAMASAVLVANVPHGRITMWLWRDKGKKMAFAMARRSGDGGDKPVRTILGAPPFQDSDKAQICFEGERR